MALLAIFFFGLTIMSSAEAGSVLINVRQIVREANISAACGTDDQAAVLKECVYQNETFAIGASIASFPEDCSQLQCEADGQGKAIITLGKPTCCFYQERTYAIDAIIENLPESCAELKCDVNSAGEPTIALIPTDCNVCLVQNREYALGETIANFSPECLHLQCEEDNQGKPAVSSVKDTYCHKYQTTCVFQGQDFSIYDVVATFPAYCSQLVCEAEPNGNAKLSLQEGNCETDCVHQGRTYPIGAIITYFFEGCFELKCELNNENKPTAVLSYEASSCNSCIYNDAAYGVGTIVGTFQEYKMALRCTAGTEGAVVTPENICLRGGKAYYNGEYLDNDHCMKLLCTNGKWTQSPDTKFSNNCDSCKLKPGLIEIFDNATDFVEINTDECRYDLVRTSGSSVISVKYKLVDKKMTIHEFTIANLNNDHITCLATFKTDGCSFGDIPQQPTQIDSQGTLAFSTTDDAIFLLPEGQVTEGTTCPSNTKK